MSATAYTQAIGGFLGVDPARVHLFWKGRVALYASLRAMGIGPGDEVLLPAYTCVVVPMAILFSGARPVYVDIRPDSYTLDPRKLRQAITENSRAIITQNTFGLSCDLEQIQAIGKTESVYVIEDCTHGFGGSYQGQPNGSFSDVAFYSTQWNKPYSSGLGGFAVAHNDELSESIARVATACVEPGSKELALLRTLIVFRQITGGLTDRAAFVRFYRKLAAMGVLPGSSSADEFDPAKIPADYLKSHSTLQATTGLRNLQKLPRVLQQRRLNARRYSRWLSDAQLNHVADELFSDHAFLRYPLRVNDRQAWMSRGLKAGINFGEWFNSPLHPEQQGLERWGLQPEHFPEAVRAGREMVNLPTDIADPQSVIEFIQHNQDLVIPQ